MLFAPLMAFAGNETDPAGARPASMGGAAVTFTDIWSLYHNQAGLAKLKNIELAAFYENRFLVDNLAFAGFAGAAPIGNGAIGLSYAGFGYDVYREGKLGLAYALNLSGKVSVGVQLNYHSLRINTDGYGNGSAITGEIGFRIQVSEKVALGVQLVNPSRTKRNDFDDERIPTLLRLGAGYAISKEVLATVEVEKDIDSDATFKAGVEYRPVDLFYLRLGASSAPQTFAFGLGFDFGNFGFDLASTYNSVLGFSPQASLLFHPAKK